MRVQIFAPIAGGPLTHYVAFLLPPLRDLMDAGDVASVTVSLSRSHFESPSFESALQAGGPGVTWDVFDDDVAELDWRSGIRCAGALLRAIDRCKPDYLISVSADYGALALGLRTLPDRWLGRRSEGMTSVGILHHGIASEVRGARARLRSVIHRVARTISPWSITCVVNPLLYDTIRTRDANATRRVRLLAHPVAPIEPIAKADARTRLGLPTHGRFVAHVGRTDGRKAIPELLGAFREARLDDDVRLVFAGPLHPRHRDRLATIDADLVASGRIVVIDRHLSDEEFVTATCAADVVASTYYPMDDLSANLLGAVAARRPVIVNDYGYAGYMVRSLPIGWACDVSRADDFARTLERAVRESATLEIDASLRALLAYHEPSNYASGVLDALYRQLGRPVPPRTPWESVVGMDRPA